MHFKTIYLQIKTIFYLLVSKIYNSLIWLKYSHIQNISFKILMFSFSAWCEFEWTFFPIIAILTIALCSIDIYDMKSVAYYFL